MDTLVRMRWMVVRVGYLFSICGVIQHTGLCVFMIKSNIGLCVSANISFICSFFFAELIYV